MEISSQSGERTNRSEAKLNRVIVSSAVERPALRFAVHLAEAAALALTKFAHSDAYVLEKLWFIVDVTRFTPI